MQKPTPSEQQVIDSWSQFIGSREGKKLDTEEQLDWESLWYGYCIGAGLNHLALMDNRYSFYCDHVLPEESKV